MSVRSLALGWAAVGLCCFGCSKNESTSNAAKSPPGTPTAAASASDPSAVAAEAFVTAVVQGDTDRATQLLTPQAIQQFAASGQRFAAPGLDSAQFRIGQVRKVSETQSLVQCLLSEKTADGATEQEMCCVMKFVEGEWRVSGIAVDTGDGQPAILNFEQPAQPQPPASDRLVKQPVEQPVEQPAAGTTPPVRTAQEATPLPQR